MSPLVTVTVPCSGDRHVSPLGDVSPRDVTLSIDRHLTRVPFQCRLCDGPVLLERPTQTTGRSPISLPTNGIGRMPAESR